MNEQTHDSQTESIQSAQNAERGGMGALVIPTPSAPPAPLAPIPTKQGRSIGNTSKGVQNTIPPQNVGGLQLGTPIPATQAGSQQGTAPTDTSKTSSGEVANTTGIPDPIKAGAEQLSGISLDNVRVHYNSSKPSQYNALGIAIDDEVHLEAGQEHLLPHELYHIIQQAEGSVHQTNTINNLPINDDPALEQEAIAQGKKIEALSKQDLLRMPQSTPKDSNLSTKGIAQEQLINYKTPQDVKLGEEAKGGNEDSKDTLLKRDNNRKDAAQVANPAAIKDIQAVAESIDNTVQLAARTVAKDPTLANINPSTGKGYLDLWRTTYSNVKAKPAESNGFLPTRLGYAVETTANHLLRSQKIGNYTIDTQVTDGATRPDIVVSQGGKEVAWLDITAANSVGHIFGKAGGKWGDVSNTYVAEVLYPSLKSPFNLASFQAWQGQFGALSPAEQIELDKAEAAAAADQKTIAAAKVWVADQFKQLIGGAGMYVVSQQNQTQAGKVNKTHEKSHKAYQYLRKHGMVHNPVAGKTNCVTKKSFLEYLPTTALYRKLLDLYPSYNNLACVFNPLAVEMGYTGNILWLEGGGSPVSANDTLRRIGKSLQASSAPAAASSSSSSSSQPMADDEKE